MTLPNPTLNLKDYRPETFNEEGVQAKMVYLENLSGGPGRLAVDMTAAPYSMVAGNASAAAANTAALKSAIAAYNGTKATLVLPSGVIYLGRDGNNNGAIRLVNVTDLTIRGQGMYATMLNVDDVTFGGDWHGIYIEGCQRLEISDLGLQQGSNLGTDGQQHHGIYVLHNGITTRDLVFHHVFFGQHGDLADAFRLFGLSGNITNVSLHNFVMKLDGIASGSRSGIALQRGYSQVEIGHGHLRGAKNSLIDMEPTGTGTMEYLDMHDLVLDNSLGQTSIALSIGGVSNGDLCYHARVRDVVCLSGRVTINSTYDCHVDRLTVVASAAWPADTTTANLQIYQVNTGLVLRDLRLERTGTAAAGNVLDCQNTGGSTTIIGGRFIQGTVGYPIYADGCSNFRIMGVPRIEYSATGFGSKAGVFLSAVNRSCPNVQIDGVDVYCSSGTLRAAVDIESRTPNSITPISVAHVNGNGTCTYGVYLSDGTGSTMDPVPMVQAVQGVVTGPWKQVNESDAPITTLYPCDHGNPGNIAHYTGTGTPETKLAAPVGSTFSRLDGGAATTLYVKETGTGNTGWVAK